MSRVIDADIRRVFLANGFTIKAGESDLKPYVYRAARELVALAGERAVFASMAREASPEPAEPIAIRSALQAEREAMEMLHEAHNRLNGLIDECGGLPSHLFRDAPLPAQPAGAAGDPPALAAALRSIAKACSDPDTTDALDAMADNLGGGPVPIDSAIGTPGALFQPYREPGPSAMPLSAVPNMDIGRLAKLIREALAGHRIERGNTPFGSDLAVCSACGSRAVGERAERGPPIHYPDCPYVRQEDAKESLLALAHELENLKA